MICFPCGHENSHLLKQEILFKRGGCAMKSCQTGTYTYF